MVNIKLEKYYSDYIIYDGDKKSDDGEICQDDIFLIKKDQLYSLYNQLHDEIDKLEHYDSEDNFTIENWGKLDITQLYKRIDTINKRLDSLENILKESKLLSS